MAAPPKTNAFRIIVTIPMLNICPVRRIVLIVADATPYMRGATAPITAWVFGEENNPNPNPITSRHATMNPVPVASWIVPSSKRPAAVSAIPIDTGPRASIRSERRPANGDDSACIAGCARRISPA